MLHYFVEVFCNYSLWHIYHFFLLAGLLFFLCRHLQHAREEAYDQPHASRRQHHVIDMRDREIHHSQGSDKRREQCQISHWCPDERMNVRPDSGTNQQILQIPRVGLVLPHFVLHHVHVYTYNGSSHRRAHRDCVLWRTWISIDF